MNHKISFFAVLRHPNRLSMVQALFSLTVALLVTTSLVPLVSASDAISDLNTNNPTAATGLNVNNYLGANRFYNAGITGKNTVTANVEAGHVWNGHETMTNVSTYFTGTEASGEYDRHATWVGMILGGRKTTSGSGNWQAGIAYGTDLQSGAIATNWNWTGQSTSYSTSFSTSNASFFSTYAHFFGTADVINSSWGFTPDTAGTSTETIALDAMARANRTTTFVVAAGNTGDSTTTSTTVNGPASGYNSISVGALTNDGSNVYTSIASFSSRGPQDFYNLTTKTTISSVRATVDIVAPGDALVSAYYGGKSGGNGRGTADSYTNYYSYPIAGTSFAAPIVAGGATLLTSASKYYSMDVDSRDSRVIKAVLMNSADKVTGWDNGQSTVSNVVTTTQSLDWALGAGRMNLDTAYDQYLSGTKNVTGMIGGTISNIGWDLGLVSSVGSHNDYVFDTKLLGGSVFDATLTWFRNCTTNTSTYDTSETGFANLDLQIWDSTFTTLIATSASLYNSSELLHFVLPSTGLYGIRVAYTGYYGTAAAESFGLAWSATAIPEPGVLVLVATGLLGFLVYGWRKRK